MRWLRRVLDWLGFVPWQPPPAAQPRLTIPDPRPRGQCPACGRWTLLDPGDGTVSLHRGPRTRYDFNATACGGSGRQPR